MESIFNWMDETHFHLLSVTLNFFWHLYLLLQFGRWLPDKFYKEEFDLWSPTNWANVFFGNYPNSNNEPKGYIGTKNEPKSEIEKIIARRQYGTLDGMGKKSWWLKLKSIETLLVIYMFVIFFPLVILNIFTLKSMLGIFVSWTVAIIGFIYWIRTKGYKKL